jgi:hypothetical protein
LSGAASATNPAVGVNVRDQWGFNLSYNTINNNNGNGVNHVTTLRGIYTTSSSINASMNINYNTLTIKGVEQLHKYQLSKIMEVLQEQITL